MKKTRYVIALGAGVLFDLLFWEKFFGYSFAVFISVFTFGFLAIEKIKLKNIPFPSILLLISANLFGLLTFIRLEPFTTFMNMAVSIVTLSIAIVTLSSGKWFQLGFSEHIRFGFHYLQQVAVFPLIHRKENASANKAHRKAKLVAILRGLFFAIPAIFFFTVLLTEADLIFNDRVNAFIEWINWERISEILTRLYLVLFISNLLLASALFARNKSAASVPSADEKPLIKPFLGHIEIGIIFGGVLIVFALFVAIQFRYLFFGGGNISEAGYTYAQYARRGFGELVAVAIFSLIMIALSTKFAKNETKRARMGHFYLVIGLVACVMVILASAFQRLLLYERAYGFTRLRMYSHIFMIWLAIFLIASAVLTFKAQPKLFTALSILFMAGFALTLNLVNVDGTIARQNILRATPSRPLDSAYLESLSFDSVPTLVNASLDSMIPGSVREDVVDLIENFENDHQNGEGQYYDRERTHFAGIYGNWYVQQKFQGKWYFSLQHSNNRIKLSCSLKE